MQITSMVAIYFLMWAFSVFLVLPFGVRTTEEAGAERVPGQAESAPHVFSPGRFILRTNIVATIMFALFMLNYEFGWVRAETFDFFGGMKPVN